jgi:hypothetical protein
MLKRSSSKKAAKSASAPKLKKTAAKKIAVQRKKARIQEHKSAAFNEKSQWKAFRELRAKVNKKLKKLKKDFKKEVHPENLIEDINLLGLLGGEVSYMLTQLEKLEKSKQKAMKKAEKKVEKKSPKKKVAPRKAAAKKVTKSKAKAKKSVK